MVPIYRMGKRLNVKLLSINFLQAIQICSIKNWHSTTALYKNSLGIKFDVFIPNENHVLI